jgi:hypothetical protein
VGSKPATPTWPEHIAELARRWRDNRCLPPDADTKAVATILLSIMQGLIVMHHVVGDVPGYALRSCPTRDRNPHPAAHFYPRNADQDMTDIYPTDLADLAVGATVRRLRQSLYRVS